MSLLPLLSLATVALAAPPVVDFDHLILSRNGSDSGNGSEPEVRKLSLSIRRSSTEVTP